MKIEKVSEEIVSDLFIKGIDCSQIVLGYAAERAGLCDETAIKVSSAFGGGMWCSRTCGVVTGALMALGMKYGHYNACFSLCAQKLYVRAVKFLMK